MKKINRQRKVNVLWQYFKAVKFIMIADCLIFLYYTVASLIRLSPNYQILMLYCFYGLVLSFLALVPFIGISAIFIWNFFLIPMLNESYGVIYEYASGISTILMWWNVLIFLGAIGSTITILYLEVYRENLLDPEEDDGEPD